VEQRRRQASCPDRLDSCRLDTIDRPGNIPAHQSAENGDGWNRGDLVRGEDDLERLFRLRGVDVVQNSVGHHGDLLLVVFDLAVRAVGLVQGVLRVDAVQIPDVVRAVLRVDALQIRRVVRGVPRGDAGQIPRVVKAPAFRVVPSDYAADLEEAAEVPRVAA
jgi:hypothetical protein